MGPVCVQQWGDDLRRGLGLLPPVLAVGAGGCSVGVVNGKKLDILHKKSCIFVHI